MGLEGNEDKYPQEFPAASNSGWPLPPLSLGPRILLMDEPFGALDRKIRLNMQELLVQLWISSSPPFSSSPLG